MTEPSRRSVWIVGAAIVIAAFALIAIKHYRDTMEMPWTLVTPSQHLQTVTRMAELRNEGHFDEAIDLGLHSISGQPGDDFIYQMLATIYFVRSLHDKDQSGKWTKLGAEYSQKALASDPNEFNVGMNYVIRTSIRSVRAGTGLMCLTASFAKEHTWLSRKKSATLNSLPSAIRCEGKDEPRPQE